MFGKTEKNDNVSASTPSAVNETDEQMELRENLNRVKHKIVVLSGKGGVGKSTVAVNIAVKLNDMGYKVGLLDVDIHGPSIPKMLGLEGERLYAEESGKLLPVIYKSNLKTQSIGYMLVKNEDAVIWRGPLKYNIIKQFLKDVLWGELDYLIIDSPPGTGDEPLSICQLIEDPDGAIVVTTPQDIALLDVKKSITFCNKLNMPVLGVVENMSGFICPHCGKGVDIFKKGGGKKMSEEMGVPFLGSIPIELGIMETGDSGRSFIESKTTDKSDAAQAFENIVNNMIDNFRG